MENNLKVGEYVIVPAQIRGCGETIKAVVTEIEPGILGSAPLVTCMYIEPSIDACGRTGIVCYEDQLQPIESTEKGGAK